MFRNETGENVLCKQIKIKVKYLKCNSIVNYWTTNKTVNFNEKNTTQKHTNIAFFEMIKNSRFCLRWGAIVSCVTSCQLCKALSMILS